MTEYEENQAVDALINWFKSQDIAPGDSVPIMAKTIVAAIVSCVNRERHSSVVKAHLREGIEIAAGMVVETFENFAKGSLK